MSQRYSFANEAREIYRDSRQTVEKMSRAGLIAPGETEGAFRKMVADRLDHLGRPAPKAWAASAKGSRRSLSSISGKTTGTVSNARSGVGSQKPTLSGAPGIGRAVASAVALSLALNGALSITKQIRRVRRGQQSKYLAAKEVAKDVGKGACAAGGIALGAELIKKGVGMAFPQTAKAIVKSSAPMAAAACAAELASDAWQGTLTAKSAVTVVTRTSATWAAAEAGGALGAWAGTFLAPITFGLSIPTGALLGAMGGGFAASSGVDSLARRFFP